MSGIFGAVGDLTAGSPALFVADAEGLRLSALDPSNVLHAEARIPRTLLWACEGSAEWALDPQKLKSFVSAGAKGGEWELTTGQDERGPLLHLKNGGLSFTTRPLPRESVRNIGPLKFDFAASLETPAEGLRGFLKTLRNAKGEADAVAIRVENGSLSLRVCDGDGEPLASLALESHEVSARGEAATWLSCELFTPALSKLLALRPDFLRLELVPKGPARLAALLDGGGEVVVLMAPREAPEEVSQEKEPTDQEEAPIPEEPEEQEEAPPDEPEPEEVPEGPEEEPPEWEVAEPLVLSLSVLALPKPTAPAPQGPKRCARCRLPESPWTPIGPDGLCDFDREMEARARA